MANQLSKFPEVFLSRPAVVLPPARLDNDEVLRRIRENFQGDEDRWSIIEATIRRVFQACNTQVRYLEPDETVRVADYASRASEAVLQACEVSAAELDLVVNGSIAREYFEPATAMEVAARLGVREVHAFDVTSACVGQLEGIHVACGHFALHGHLGTALICSAELTRQFLGYSIQATDDLDAKVAALTIGNAAAAFLLRRQPFPGGCLELLAACNHSLPEHWHLCTAPIDGTFNSLSGELFKLNVYVAPELKRVLDGLGWAPGDVEHYVFHQPSDLMVRKVLDDLDVDPGRAILTHALYANTSSTAVALAMNRLLETREVRAGDKMILSSAAAGFSQVTLAGEWVE